MSALDWQHWLVDLAARRMAEDKENLDDFGPDEDLDDLTAAINRAETVEEEREADINRFIAGGHTSHRT